MKIKVKNCQECPFCNRDNEYGADRCNLWEEIFVPDFDELPKKTIHEKCPLRNGMVEVSL